MKLGSLIKLVCLTLVVSIFSSTLLTGCIFLRSCTADLFSTEFNLTEADIRNYESAAESFEKSVIEGKNSLTVTLRSSMFVDGFSKIYTQYMIAYLNYCVDMKDEKALANYKFAFNAYNDANKLYTQQGWEKIKQTVTKAVIDVSKRMRSGYISAIPMIEKNYSPCNSCKFKAFCRNAKIK